MHFGVSGGEWAALGTGEGGNDQCGTNLCPLFLVPTDLFPETTLSVMNFQLLSDWIL